MSRALISLGVLAASLAVAQTTPVVVSLERLSLEPGSAHSLSVGSGDGLRGGSLRVSLVGHYEYEPLVFRSQGARVGDIVSSRATANLNVAWAPWDWVELSAQLPVFTQAGDDLTGSGISRVASTGVGAPTVRARVTLLRQDLGSPLDLGLTAGTELPLGSTAGLARDPGAGWNFMPRVGLGRRLTSSFRVGLELGADLREQPTFIAYSTQPAQALNTLVTAGLTLSSVGSGLRFGLDVRGTSTTNATPAAALEALAQVRWPLHGGVDLLAGAGPGFGRLAGTPTFRALLGVTWSPLGGAACVEGLAYRVSDCPLLDRDGDGPRNADDACPELAGPASNAGCPLEAPLTATEAYFMAKRVDLDLDGTFDAFDRCPAQPGPPQHQGCPDFGPDAESTEVDLAQFLSQQIHFEFDSARLVLDGDALAEAADLLQAVPAGRITIEGHTDSKGSRAYNAKLSVRRAEAVRAALVEAGVDPERLQVEGRAFDDPVASNQHPSGRALNRRVRFLLSPSPREEGPHAP